jgi:hypothetical protein
MATPDAANDGGWHAPQACHLAKEKGQLPPNQL